MATPKRPQRGKYRFNMVVMLDKVKENLRLPYDDEDDLLERFIRSAVAFAERNQHRDYGFYQTNPMQHDTELAVVMLASHYFETRDGAGGLTGNRADASQNTMKAVQQLLSGDREPVV